MRPEYENRDFYFDRVLAPGALQAETYDEVARPVVQDVIDGFNGVVMAYGQTGSGKTHTIFGSKPSIQDYQVQENLRLISKQQQNKAADGNQQQMLMQM